MTKNGGTWGGGSIYNYIILFFVFFFSSSFPSSIFSWFSPGTLRLRLTLNPGPDWMELHTAIGEPIDLKAWELKPEEETCFGGG